MNFKPQLNRASFVRNAKDSVSIELTIFDSVLIFSFRFVCVCVFGFCCGLGGGVDGFGLCEDK